MSFTEARKFFPAEGEPITVYISAEDPCHWVLQHVCGHFFCSNSDEKLRFRFQDTLDSVKEIHKAVWPDNDVPEIRVSKRSEEAQDESIFVENTIPTSVVVCACIKNVLAHKRQLKLRQSAYMLLRSLVTGVFQSLGDEDRKRKLVRTTTQGRFPIQVSIDNRGRLETPLWSKALGKQLEKFWNEELINASVPWISSVFEKPHIADLICFGLDTAPKSMGRLDRVELEHLRATMAVSFQFLVSDVVHEIEYNIRTMTKTQEHSQALLKAVGPSKPKRRKLSPMEMNMAIATALKLMYSKDAPRR
eukprot:s212_g7.t1